MQHWSRWMTSVAYGGAPLVLIVLLLGGAPWPIMAVVAAILLLPLVLAGLRAVRHR